MRVLPTVMFASALALGACDKPAPPANDVANTGAMPADNMATDNASAGAGTAMNFASGDGKPLGSVTATDSPAGLVLTLAGTGMPSGVHGIHIHAVGTCDGPKFESAGGHFNPDGKMHGSKNPNGPHQGDLPNINVGADGVATGTLTAAGVTLAALQDADGAALVVHAKADDLATDPSGDSGDRIACAVIAPPR